MSLQDLERPGASLGAAANSLLPVSDVSKRLMDILLASTMLVVAAPVLSLVSAALFLTVGQILCSDERLGKGGRTFHCLRFRTTHAGVGDDATPTRIGRFLRATSLNELPQLLNVIRGDMSLVGPHPVGITDFVAHYVTVSGPAYLSVRPGITGPWQLSTSAHAGFAHRVEQDCLYASRRSLGGDILLLLRTVAAIMLNGH